MTDCQLSQGTGVTSALQNVPLATRQFQEMCKSDRKYQSKKEQQCLAAGAQHLEPPPPHPRRLRRPFRQHLHNSRHVPQSEPLAIPGIEQAVDAFSSKRQEKKTIRDNLQNLLAPLPHVTAYQRTKRVTIITVPEEMQLWFCNDSTGRFMSIRVGFGGSLTMISASLCVVLLRGSSSDSRPVALAISLEACHASLLGDRAKLSLCAVARRLLRSFLYQTG